MGRGTMAMAGSVACWRRKKLRNFYLNMLIQAAPLSWPIRQSLHCSCKDSHIKLCFLSTFLSPTLLARCFIDPLYQRRHTRNFHYLFSISNAYSQLISIHLVSPDCLRLEHFSLIWISKSTFSEPEVSHVIKDRALSHSLATLSCLKCNSATLTARRSERRRIKQFTVLNFG